MTDGRTRPLFPRYAFRGISPKKRPEAAWTSSRNVPGLGMIPPALYQSSVPEIRARQAQLSAMSQDQLIHLYIPDSSRHAKRREHTCWSRDLLWALKWILNLEDVVSPSLAISELKRRSIAIVRLDQDSVKFLDAEAAFNSQTEKLASGDARAKIALEATKKIEAVTNNWSNYKWRAVHARNQEEIVIMGVVPETDILVINCFDFLEYCLPQLGCSISDVVKESGYRFCSQLRPLDLSPDHLITRMIRQRLTLSAKVIKLRASAASLSLYKCGSSTFGVKRLANAIAHNTTEQAMVQKEELVARSFYNDFAGIFTAWLTKVMLSTVDYPSLRSELFVPSATELGHRTESGRKQ